MPTTRITADFNGKDPVDRKPGDSQVEWSDSFLGYYSVYEGAANTDLVANVNLSGKDWTVATMRFGSTLPNTTIMKDEDGDSGRRIDYLQLGFNSDVDLMSTRVRHITGWDGDKHDVTLGNNQSGSTYSISLFAKENVVTTGNAWVNSINTGAAQPIGDTITIGSGGAGSVMTDSGDDVVKTGQGYVGLIDTRDGDDMITTGSSFVDFILSGRGNDIVRIGSGGADTVKTRDGNDVIKASGSVESIRGGEGNDKITTGSGYVETISTHGGNDKVFMGTGGVGFIRTDDGNDTVFANEMPSDYGVVLQGGGGTDTVDFKKFKSDVTFSLDEAGRYMNVSPPGNDPDEPGKGYFSESGFENVRGSNNNDTLTGDGGNNVLLGRKGNDTIEGMGGNDRIIGAAGKDVFVFGEDSGTDTVKGYQKGSDVLRILDHSGGFQSLDISKSGKNLEIDHDGGTIVLAGRSGLQLSSDDFDFV